MDPDHAPGTLGALLYDGTRTSAPEEEWRRLVESVAAGDQRALHALYARSHRMVYTLVVRITHERSIAEEVTLDVFHDVWRRASSYAPAGGSVVGWIMNQARSRAIDRVRFEHRRKRVPSGAPAPPAVESHGPDEALGARERAAALREALAVLTRDERQAIDMTFFSELSYRDAAARLELPDGTVKTRIRSGLRKLRLALGKVAERP